jgi:hypothetical protein
MKFTGKMDSLNIAGTSHKSRMELAHFLGLDFIGGAYAVKISKYQ